MQIQAKNQWYFYTSVKETRISNWVRVPYCGYKSLKKVHLEVHRPAPIPFRTISQCHNTTFASLFKYFSCGSATLDKISTDIVSRGPSATAELLPLSEIRRFRLMVLLENIDKCNGYGYRLTCRKTAIIVVCSVCPLLSDLSVCNVGVLWPNSLTDQDETWHAGYRPRYSVSNNRPHDAI